MVMPNSSAHLCLKTADIKIRYMPLIAAVCQQQKQEQVAGDLSKGESTFSLNVLIFFLGKN